MASISVYVDLHDIVSEIDRDDLHELFNELAEKHGEARAELLYVIGAELTPETVTFLQTILAGVEKA